MLVSPPPGRRPPDPRLRGDGQRELARAAEDAEQKQTAINPRMIVEVLSPATEDYDRGEKLGHYKKIPSLVEVMLVAHDRHEVEIVRRESDGSWSREIARASDVARLTSIQCDLLMRRSCDD